MLTSKRFLVPRNQDDDANDDNDATPGTILDFNVTQVRQTTAMEHESREFNPEWKGEGCTHGNTGGG